MVSTLSARCCYHTNHDMLGASSAAVWIELGPLGLSPQATTHSFFAGCKSAFPASKLPSLEAILQLYVLSMSSE